MLLVSALGLFKVTLKPRLVVDWLAIDQQALDRGAIRRRNGGDDRKLALVAGVFELPALPLRDEVALDAVAHLRPPMTGVNCGWPRRSAAR